MDRSEYVFFSRISRRILEYQDKYYRQVGKEYVFKNIWGSFAVRFTFPEELMRKGAEGSLVWGQIAHNELSDNNCIEYCVEFRSVA